MPSIRTVVLRDADAVARAAAALIATEARASVAAHGRFVFAASGGRTPWVMLRFLADLDVPWRDVHIVQVDERVAPEGDAERNLTHLRESLLAHVPLPPGHMHAMPVDAADLDEAARRYGATLAAIAGAPPVIDLVHLGLGPDGHTASLVPDDSVLDVDDRDVALAGPYLGLRRMTLTFPSINRARRILFVVTGADKVAILARVCAGDRTIPAGRVAAADAIVLADAAASPGIQPDTESATAPEPARR